MSVPKGFVFPSECSAVYFPGRRPPPQEQCYFFFIFFGFPPLKKVESGQRLTECALSQKTTPRTDNSVLSGASVESPAEEIKPNERSSFQADRWALNLKIVPKTCPGRIELAIFGQSGRLLPGFYVRGNKTVVDSLARSKWNIFSQKVPKQSYLLGHLKKKKI